MKQHISKTTNTASSAPVHTALHGYPITTHGVRDSNEARTAQDLDSQQYHQDTFEETKLNLQAKYGTITPEQQERLAFLQAKRADFWQRYLANAGKLGHSFADIPVTTTQKRHGAGGAFAVEASPLGLASGGGRPLPEAVRGKMEAAFGADFPTVRVHVGPQWPAATVLSVKPNTVADIEPLDGLT
jgi:hypothetical protein